VNEYWRCQDSIESRCGHVPAVRKVQETVQKVQETMQKVQETVQKDTLDTLDTLDTV